MNVRGIAPGGLLAVLLTAGATFASPARAQSAAELGEACFAAGGSTRLCRGSVIAAQALTAQVGLLAGTGAEVPGTATTLGTRVGGGPRLAFSVRAGLVDMGYPELIDPLVTSEGGGLASTLHVRASAGLFDGLQLMPTVGGFLSVDVFGQASLLFLPDDQGVSAGSRSYSLGLRVGLLREGFTVPGISLSAARRFPDDFEYPTGGGAAILDVSPSVTSYRAIVGKDLFAVEWLAGIGYDRYRGDVVMDLLDDSGLGTRVEVSGPLEDGRLLYFGGASMTLSLVLTMSVEVGWARGFDPVSGWTGPHDPTAGTAFGALAARLTL